MQPTVCIRCGKTRIVLKSWTEQVDGRKTSYTQSVCPDKACQKLVEEEIERRNQKTALIQAKSQERRKHLQISRKTKAKPRRV